MIDKYNLAIGKAMRYQRTLKRLSLQQVADKIGLAKNTVAYYEKGKISISVNNLKIYCDAVGINYVDLLNAVENTLNTPE